MPLKKSVCKKCRIKEIGKEDGWTDMAEAWFNPWYNNNGVKTRDGHTYCPYPIFEPMIENMKKLILKYGSANEKSALLNEVIYIENKHGSPKIYSHNPPPAWCPYEREHK